MPKKASDFSGNMMVEWFNVSGGVDANPEWVSCIRRAPRT
jgi:hypothetical protein